MKVNLGRELFDEYAWKARVLPALILISPASICAFVFGWLNWVVITLSLLATLGVIFLVAQIVRSFGTKAEARLIIAWGGMPTTHLLRLNGTHNRAALNQRRAKLEALLSVKLPSRQIEQRNMTRADEAYVTATRSLISMVRSKKDHFPRVHEENINYGFRRNLLGIKGAGVILNSALLIGLILAGLLSGWSVQMAISLIVVGLFLLLWLFIVTERWVREAANSYANRLFETLDESVL